MDLMTWQDRISDWHQNRKHDQVEILETILYQAPDAVFGPVLTDNQSKAIACWLDGCLRVFQSTRHCNHNKAFQMLQYTSAKLEQAAYQPNTHVLIKDWCLRRLQHVTVLTLEFCNQQNDQSRWKPLADHLIETHVRVMRSLHWNESGKHDQGVRH